jgi:hypothetical protein
VLAYGGAILFGASVGTLRMAFGGHFFTDVVFAGFFTFLIVWTLHGLLYRWRTRPSDAALEAALKRAHATAVAPLSDVVARLAIGMRRVAGRARGRQT